VPRASLRGPRPNLLAGSMRLGGNGAMRKLAAQKTRPHGAARNQQKPAAVRGTLNGQSPERSGGVVAIQPAAKYAGNGGRDSVPRPGVQTIERGGFGRSFRFRRPHCGAGNGPVPKWSHTCSDRHPKCPFRGEYSMHIVEVRRNGVGSTLIGSSRNCFNSMASFFAWDSIAEAKRRCSRTPLTVEC
jgi:hypothetical protein